MTLAAELRSPATGTCTFGVIFTPPQTGPVTGNIIVTDNAVMPTQSITVSGVGYHCDSDGVAEVVCRTAGSRSIRCSPPQTVTLIELQRGGRDLHFDRDQRTLCITANSCGSSVPANSTCQVSVTFNPTTDSTASGTTETGKLTFTDNGQVPTQTVTLTGIAFGAAATATRQRPRAVTPTPSCDGDRSHANGDCDGDLDSDRHCATSTATSTATVTCNRGPLLRLRLQPPAATSTRPQRRPSTAYCQPSTATRHVQRRLRLLHTATATCDSDGNCDRNRDGHVASATPTATATSTRGHRRVTSWSQAATLAGSWPALSTLSTATVSSGSAQIYERPHRYVPGGGFAEYRARSDGDRGGAA